MQHINITVHNTDAHLQLIRGVPDEVTAQRAVAHMMFSYGNLDVEVWIVGKLTEVEKEQITQSVFSYLEALDSPTPPVQSSPPIPTNDAPHNRILVVDDEENTLEVLQMYLELSGYQVITTVNSEQAVHLVEQEHPDCVLLDVMMPGLDGFSLCKLIRSTPTIDNVPVIFCTAYSALDVEDRRRAAGGDLVIMKPFEMNALTQAIKAMLARRQQTIIPKTPQAPKPMVKHTAMLGSMSMSLKPNSTAEAYLAALDHLITGQ